MQSGIRSYCYCFNSIPTADDLESPFFLIYGRDPLEGHTGLLGKSDIRYLGDDKGLILFAEIDKFWLAYAKAQQENRQLKQISQEKQNVEVDFLWNRTVDSLKTSLHPLLWTSSGLRDS